MTSRQRSLLVTEDWKKIYQTFREADFQSYDFETLRKSMIDYIRLYYPEDFNDFIESSEYIALIDLIAFLGQGLAFRGELNARENFIDTAERRESILRLAKLINYSPKRNIPARGMLKVDSVRTTEAVYDSDGVNLSGSPVQWNDVGNSNWQEQFISILNAALTSSQRVGRSGNSVTINGIKTDEYQLNLPSTAQPRYATTSTVEGMPLPFEIVGVTSAGDVNLRESDPRNGAPLNILYRNDKLGNNSNNTGYFVYFKQGIMGNSTITLPDSIPNRIISVNVANINDMDIWLYKLDAAGNPTEVWTRVPAITGNNIAYNSLSNVNRKIYQVVTRDNDQIDLVFGDGIFAEVPQGTFVVFYRTSAGSGYKITADELQSIPVSFKYLSKAGRIETLTLTSSLKYTVANSAPRETAEEIKLRAPQQYYTQNRMITGEDYNLFPYTAFSTVIKAKSVNRTSSGISRYLDVIDSTGKYSSTNIYGEDGWLYSEETIASFEFSYMNNNDIIKVIRDNLTSVLKSTEMLNFYYEKFPAQVFDTNKLTWVSSTTGVNNTTGYFVNEAGYPAQIGKYVVGTARYLRPGCMLKVVAPDGYYFDGANMIRAGVANKDGDRTEFYTSIISVDSDGTNHGIGNLSDGTGPVSINEVLSITTSMSAPRPVIYSVNAAFTTVITPEFEQELLTLIKARTRFGIRYDQASAAYAIITGDALDTTSAFSLAGQGTASDSSWLAYCMSDVDKYIVKYRQFTFVFESKLETRFYFDKTVRIFDPKTAQVVTDYIKVLKINPSATNTAESIKQDYTMRVHGVFTGQDGFRDNTKVKVTYPDVDRDSVPDNINFFSKIVDPANFVFFKYTTDSYGFSRFAPIPTASVNSLYASLTALQADINHYAIGTVFFVTGTRVFYELIGSGVDNATRTLSVISSAVMQYRPGRGHLYYQYRHNSPNNRRIDPSPNNLIDLYLLTKQYNTDYVAWARDNTGKIPAPTIPTGDELRIDYGSLENYKPVSDTLLYSSAKFKPLFGSKADPALRATFKVVKSNASNVSDSEVRSKMVKAINDYFDIANWDFGETFYFSELSSYLHQALSTLVSSIVLVPTSGDMQFGSLYQVDSEPDEIIISAATVDNIEIISSLTLAQLAAG